MGMLEVGVTKQGATSKSFDKYGQRMWVGTPVRNTTMKDTKIMHNSRPAVCDSSCKRTDVGVK